MLAISIDDSLEKFAKHWGFIRFDKAALSNLKKKKNMPKCTSFNISCFCVGVR